MITNERCQPFFHYAKHRYYIHLKRAEGQPCCFWTADDIFQNYRFTNIFREDDRVTHWFRENYRDQFKNSTMVFWGTVIFRWFNKIETGEILLKHDLLNYWNTEKAREVLKDQKPLVNGAYIIKTPNGYNKLDGICWCIDEMRKRATSEDLSFIVNNFMNKIPQSLQEFHSFLTKFPFMGPFMAYEVVTDLRHTGILNKAIDINTWANPGPGAVRGLCRVYGHPLSYWNRNSSAHVKILIEKMQELLEQSRFQHNWPSGWPKWEMREVEHTLCEFDKYERARLGEGKPKQLFRTQERKYQCIV